MRTQYPVADRHAATMARRWLTGARRLADALSR
jgi:hypothetical protein